jgi:glycosyltransferase involved in cell wall biosynthesis
MRILHLTPGTGSFHCGSCLRDNALIRALRSLGHDAIIAPLYLPMVTDADDMGGGAPVRVGGISLYLQQKFPFFHSLPRFIRHWFDDEKKLRWAAKHMGMTSARDLGEMTVGSLLGEKGRQWPEWQRLVEWIATDVKPEVVTLSNALLVGLAPAIHRATGAPVVCCLQGEDAFLDTLVEPYRTQAWDLVREMAKSVSRFVAPSKFYAEVMAPRIGVPAEDVAVVYNGLNFDSYDKHVRQEPAVPTIGYLARMIHGKGLTTLVDAFITLAKRNTVPNLKLRVAGAKTNVDEAYVTDLQRRLKAAQLDERVSWEPNVSFDDKVKFLHEITVLSVPATYGEAFGLYVAEAQAAGVPVVQPKHGAFPEILAMTEGGVLCDPDDPEALAKALEDLLLDDAKRRAMGEAARFNSRAQFSAASMAGQFDKVLASLSMPVVR